MSEIISNVETINKKEKKVKKVKVDDVKAKENLEFIDKFIEDISIDSEFDELIRLEKESKLQYEKLCGRFVNTLLQRGVLTVDDKKSLTKTINKVKEKIDDLLDSIVVDQ